MEVDADQFVVSLLLVVPDGTLLFDQPESSRLENMHQFAKAQYLFNPTPVYRQAEVRVVTRWQVLRARRLRRRSCYARMTPGSPQRRRKSQRDLARVERTYQRQEMLNREVAAARTAFANAVKDSADAMNEYETLKAHAKISEERVPTLLKNQEAAKKTNDHFRLGNAM